jgi:pimeloyl-ACP methyl ester carboxylesterase
MGEGPLDLVFVPGFIAHLEHQWEEPHQAAFFRRLATFARLIRFDKRGAGLSDRVDRMPTIEERIDDVRAVMDAVGSERAAVLGLSEGGADEHGFLGNLSGPRVEPRVVERGRTLEVDARRG